MKKLYFFLIFCILSEGVMGQISPPGMDDTNVVAWGAIGLNQQIGKKWAVTVYGGAARESNPNNKNLLQKQAIIVFNQETQYQFNSHWLLSFCSSFRIQDRYKEDTPNELQNPPLRDEARLYLRLYYKHSLKKIGMAYSFRPEYRAFYDTHWNHWDGTPFELRFRLKAQANVPLNALKTNQFILANEFLSATDDQRNANHELHWSAYRFTEDRLTTYLRHIFTKQSIIVDVGMMHQIKFDKGKSDYIAQFAFDILFQNPFWKPKSDGH